MSEILTEKEIPIQKLWLLKGLVDVFVVFLLLLIFLSFFILHSSTEKIDVLHILSLYFSITTAFFFILSIPLFLRFVRRLNFHFAFGQKNIVLRQGTISQQYRAILYADVRNVHIHQGVFERICGLASITFDDSSQIQRNSMNMYGQVRVSKNLWIEHVGFLENRVHIPGLRLEDALRLQTYIVQKGQENTV